MKLSGRFPAIVDSYDQTTRECLIKIPFLTDDSEQLLLADIEYPIGDKFNNTEIEILTGDEVWIAFIGGDSRYPIITGYRNPKIGNAIDWRKFHHKNIEISANEIAKITAKELIIDANISITGTVTNNGINISSTHIHPQGADSAGNSQQNTGTPK